MAALGKSHSHTTKTHRQYLCCRHLVGNDASPVQKFRGGPCDL